MASANYVNHLDAEIPLSHSISQKLGLYRSQEELWMAIMSTPADTSRTHSPEQMSTAYGFEQVGEGEKQGKVNEVFHSVARRYDMMNDVMSLGATE